MPIYTEKFKNLVLYILANEHYKDEGIKKLNKVLYFVDFYFYRDHERLISGVTYAKAPMGPIVNDYQTIFKQMVQDDVLHQKSEYPAMFTSNIDYTLSEFSPEEVDHIHKVLEKYGRLSSTELEAISHQQQPWVLTERMGDIIDPDLALLIADDSGEELEITDENLKNELERLANSA
ncbi:MAG: Panacea domain-containing protein [Patescibacteria group bacterium]